ncbi:MAG: TonB-dependent receptor [Deltaproteobacteria bacterium]|nr:MAG: TonB-dependent receptor [Deltaproteobacteria bacterium]
MQFVHTTYFFHTRWILALLTYFFLAGQFAWAAEPSLTSEADTAHLEEIIVTAEKRAQNVQDIPASMTTLNADLIEDARIEDMDGIASCTPGLDFSNAGSRRHSITFMRGIKNIHNAEPAMGYYVDGVSYSKSYMFDFPLLDIERIEILKGPQGTLYGRNSMAGVINIVTPEPDNTARGKASVDIGTDNLLQIRGNVLAPLVHDKVFLSISGSAKKQDGYMENTVQTAGEEGRHTEGGAGRIKLKFSPSDKLNITLAIDGQSWDEGAFPLRRTARNPFVVKGTFQADETYHYSHDVEGSAETGFWGSSLHMAYRLPFAELTSITGYRDYQTDESLDADFTLLDMLRMDYMQKDTNLTQEFRLASSESEADLQWLAGVYFFHNKAENHSTTHYRSVMTGNPRNPFGANTGSRLDISDGTNKGAAVFGQATCSFANKFDLTLGIRYEYEDAEMKWSQRDLVSNGSTNALAYPSGANDCSSLLPKASISWHLAENQMVYATFAGGHRSGGFNKLSPDYDTSYDEEMSWLYEIGSKLAFLEQKLIVNMAAFYMDITDEQITQFDPNINAPYTVNAGESHRMGLEAEIRFTPMAGLDLNAGFTFLEAAYDKYSDPAKGTDYSGNQVFNVPACSGNIGIQYRRSLYEKWNFLGRIDIAGLGKRYLDDANRVDQDAYALVNTKIGIEGEHLDIYLWANNLFDHHYVTFENTWKGLTEDGSPMTAGISLGYRL